MPASSKKSKSKKKALKLQEATNSGTNEELEALRKGEAC